MKTGKKVKVGHIRIFSLWRQELKNSVLLLREARLSFECMMWYFSVTHNLQVFELGL